jgi:hypothetical protein
MRVSWTNLVLLTPLALQECSSCLGVVRVRVVICELISCDLIPKGKLRRVTH